MPDTLTQYPLRDVPLDLWRAVKIRAATDGLPIRSVILALLRTYAERGLTREARATLTE